jgi:hypothetical protein
MERFGKVYRGCCGGGVYAALCRYGEGEVEMGAEVIRGSWQGRNCAWEFEALSYEEERGGVDEDWSVLY